MSKNDSIFSGISAHRAREVADELHGREWFAADENFLDLVGAVTTLAREVDQLSGELGKARLANEEYERRIEALERRLRGPSHVPLYTR